MRTNDACYNGEMVVKISFFAARHKMEVYEEGLATGRR
jgi:hypothetical protein